MPSIIGNAVGSSIGAEISQSEAQNQPTFPTSPSGLFGPITLNANSVSTGADTDQTTQGAAPISGSTNSDSPSQQVQTAIAALGQQYGGIDQIPAFELRNILSPVLPTLANVSNFPGSVNPTFVASLDQSLMGSADSTLEASAGSTLKGLWSETAKNVAITGGYITGLFQGVGDTVLGLGSLALTVSQAADYLSKGGDAFGLGTDAGRQAYQSISAIGASIGQIVQDPTYYLGQSVGTTVDAVSHALDVANSTGDAGDWFLYGAAVGKVTVDIGSLVLGAAGVAEGATSLASKLTAFVDAAGPAASSAGFAGKSGISAIEDLSAVSPSPSGNLSASKFNASGYSLTSLTPAERNIALQIMTSGDQTGGLTEQLVESVASNEGLISVDGGKYGSDNGFDHIFQAPDGNVTILLDSKQITNGSASLNTNTASGVQQMTDSWVQNVLNNLDPASPAYQAVSDALSNGTLVKGVVGVNRNTGALTVLRVK